MAVKPKDEPTTEEPAKDDPPEDKTSGGGGGGLEERLDRLEQAVSKLLAGGGTKTEGTKVPTRAEREASVGEEVRREIAKLRAEEKGDTERKTLIDRIDQLEEALKGERQPESYSRGAKFWFPTGGRKK
ncbi:MAG: hypothetical protein ACYCV4_18075 [Dermatophilaceae bacterium]